MARTEEGKRRRLEASRVLAAKRRAKARTEGLCIDCLKKAPPGRSHCDEHGERARASYRRFSKTEKARQIRERHRPKERVTKRAWETGVGRFSHAAKTARFRLKKRFAEPWTLTPEEYWALLERGCAYCLFSVGPCGVGLDRLDNAKGYWPGNVVACCGDCNRARGTSFTPEETKLIGAAIQSIKLSRL